MTIDDAHDKSQMYFKPEKARTLVFVLLLTCLAVLIQGYHPGAEDDAVYLAAIQSDLNPSLYPHDAQFFRVQMQASQYDRLMAASVRVLHLPVNVVMFAWQLAAIALLLYACLRMARRLFAQAGRAAHCSAVAMVAVLFSLPIAGTALFLVDPQLHPRTLAASLILFAAESILAKRAAWALPLLIGAAVLHPIMGAFGMSFCACLFFLSPPAPLPAAPSSPQTATPALALATPVPGQRPLAWLFDKPTPVWHQAMNTRHYIFITRWEWYEWLGAVAPPLLLAWCDRMARKQGRRDLARICRALVWYSVLQLAVALLIAACPPLVRMLPLQPMRFLHLVYLFGALIAGGLLGEFVLRRKLWRWAVVYVPLALALFAAERALFPATPHLELPGIRDGARSTNPWLQAFAWIDANTPTDAWFALDPRSMSLPAEDYHGFRALARRSVLADQIKDSAVAMQVPRLAPIWLEQVTATEHFRDFTPADFARLQRQFGVTWTIVDASKAVPFDCPYTNATVKVCKLPPQ